MYEYNNVVLFCLNKKKKGNLIRFFVFYYYYYSEVRFDYLNDEKIATSLESRRAIL